MAALSGLIQIFHSIHPAYSISGFIVGLLVGLTGVGGGSLMTPLLVIMFGIPATTAVGTDLLYACITKGVGTAVHGFSRTVEWPIVLRLATGSVPGTALTLIALSHFQTRTTGVSTTITTVLGCALILTAVSIIFRKFILNSVAEFMLSDKASLSDEQRRLLVACGAGAGMAAAYGVPLGGALFALEVLRGMLALRLVLPALLTSVIATVTAWLVLPDAPTYVIPHFDSSVASLAMACLVGPVAGLVSVAFVRAIAWADKNRPKGWQRLVAPLLALGLLGLLSIPFPQLLGNGKDIAQLTFGDQIPFALLLMLLLLKPAAAMLCLGSGVPGGLFTPSLALGALLGAVLGHACAFVWPDVQPGLVAVVGAGAVLAATTQGPISAVVLMMELTGQDRSFIAPLLLTVVIATLLSRLIEPRSIYDARLTDEEIAQRQKLREPAKR